MLKHPKKSTFFSFRAPMSMILFPSSSAQRGGAKKAALPSVKFSVTTEQPTQTHCEKSGEKKWNKLFHRIRARAFPLCQV